MTYNPEIPIETASPNDSASPIQVNFSQFASIFALNHIAMNNTNQGKHGTVIMQKQTDDPSVAIDESILYCKNATTKAGTQPQLFSRIQKFLPNDGANDPVQLTYNSVGLTAPIYYSFLPGGYLIYFGSAVKGATVTLTPTPTKILCAQAFPTGTGAANHGAAKTNVPYDVWVTVTQVGATVKINSTRAPNGSAFLWMAIGSN
jgi:hypothetical protein